MSEYKTRQVLLVGFSALRHQTKYNKQIATRNHKKTHDPITRQRLAYDVARLVGGYLEVSK